MFGNAFYFLQNILENFNPSSRQMIATGKAYLKSLHGKDIHIEYALTARYYSYTKQHSMGIKALAH